METLHTSANYNDVDTNLANIISINMFNVFGDGSEDYDFNHDSNELYFESQGCTYTFLT